MLQLHTRLGALDTAKEMTLNLHDASLPDISEGRLAR